MERVDMRVFWLSLGIVAVLEMGGCSTHNQQKLRDEVREDAHKTAEEAKKAGREIKKDARKLSDRVGAVVKPDSESASDKLANGAARVKDAASQAEIKLDHASILARVKGKLLSDAGLSTLGNVDVGLEGTIVTLDGTVNSAEQKKAAEAVASTVAGVTRVKDRLTVQSQ